MGGHEAEVGGVGGGADVGGDGGLVEADDVVPAFFYKVMGDGCPDDAALADDYDLSAGWKCRHGWCPLLQPRAGCMHAVNLSMGAGKYPFRFHGIKRMTGFEPLGGAFSTHEGTPFDILSTKLTRYLVGQLKRCVGRLYSVVD